MTTRVLIFETDPDFCASIASHLRQAGFAVVEAVDRTQTLAVLNSGAVDVAVLGLARMGRQGLTLLRQIRTDWPAIQVITLNESEQIELSIEAMKMGVFADLMPPFDRDALCDSVRAAGRRPTPEPQGGVA
jgi:DNA-binding NtrC family response regulator